MPDLEVALKALAELGYWTHSPFPEMEMFRVELRRACRVRGIKVRTGIGNGDCLWVSTPDGLPAEEPWRGATQSILGSEVADDFTRAAVDAAYKRPQSPLTGDTS